MGENSFGSEVKKIRNSRGLTITQVAKKAGLSNGMISQIENDKRKIFQDSFFQVLSALDINNASTFFSLIKSGSFMCGWPEDAIEYCEKLKNILEDGEGKHITAIKEMIDVYSEKASKTPKKGLLKKAM